MALKRNSRRNSRNAPGERELQGRAFEKLLQSDPELLRSLVDQAADAVCLHQIDGRILDVNQRMCTTLGYSREELLALSVLEIDVTATEQETVAATARLVRGVPQTALRVLRRKDGSTFPIELSLSLIESGGTRLLLGIARDITDRRRAERAREEAQRVLEERVRERTLHLEVANRRLENEIRARERSEDARKLLLRELDHRVKNAFATVQAVAELTLRKSESLEAFGVTFRDRIAALARMHDVVWRNKGTPLQLRELVGLSLNAFGRDGCRSSIEGPDVSIPLESAGSVGLVLHELATNAVKHGALSVPAGRVCVSWRLEGRWACLDWRESGGPRVDQPTHRGFGSELIAQSIPYELGGSAALEFEVDGVHCTLAFPLETANERS